MEPALATSNIDPSIFEEFEEDKPQNSEPPETASNLKIDTTVPSAQPPISSPPRFAVTATKLNSPDSQLSEPKSPIVPGTIVRPQSSQQQHFTVVGQVIQPNSITRGVVLSSNIPQAPQLTAETLAVNSIQYDDEPSDLKTIPKSSDIQSNASTLYAIKSQETRSREYSLTMPFRSLVESLQSFSEGMTTKRPEKKKIDEVNVRDVFPRMPWHDVHGCVTGLPARDLAAHFIQVLWR